MLRALLGPQWRRNTNKGVSTFGSLLGPGELNIGSPSAGVRAQERAQQTTGCALPRAPAGRPCCAPRWPRGGAGCVVAP